eukprot:TRINITY_DN33791_c0_g1_i1.p1 TRINITY_DN33791_c0_g1~~TRINITY_DN33791_c0_g1_i1.p1  ORF type:complete len:240 (+),score=44.11 TRINITY_DN33791_c0_g1_i1:37-756(+)
MAPPSYLYYELKLANGEQWYCDGSFACNATGFMNLVIASFGLLRTVNAAGVAGKAGYLIFFAGSVVMWVMCLVCHVTAAWAATHERLLGDKAAVQRLQIDHVIRTSYNVGLLCSVAGNLGLAVITIWFLVSEEVAQKATNYVLLPVSAMSAPFVIQMCMTHQDALRYLGLYSAPAMASLFFASIFVNSWLHALSAALQILAFVGLTQRWMFHETHFNQNGVFYLVFGIGTGLLSIACGA